MPIRVSQVKREYPNFPGQSTNFLAANVNNWVKTTFQIQCYSLVESSIDNPVYITCNSAGRTIIKRVNGKWSDEGIVAGSEVYISVNMQDQSAGSSPINGQSWTTGFISEPVLFVSPDDTIIEVGATLNDPNNTDYIGENILFPTTRSEGYQTGYYKAYIFKSATFDSIDFFYNMVANSEKNNRNLNSLIDGTQSRFNFENLDASDPNTYDFTQVNYKSGSSIKSVKVTAQPSGSNPEGKYNIPGTELPNIDGSGSGQLVQPGQVISLYKIEIIHKIWGIEEDINGIANDEAPEWFLDTECLTDLAQFRLFETIANQNVFIESDLQASLIAVDGNTGYRGEVYNGNPTNKSIESVSYENILGTPIEDLDYGNETRVNVVVNNPDHDANTVYQFNFQYLPNNSDQYYNKLTSYMNNTIQNTPLKSNDFDGVDLTGLFKEGTLYGLFTGEQSPDGARMDLDQFEVIDLGGGQVLLTFKLIPNNEFYSYMDSQTTDNRRFVMDFNVNQSTDTINTSDSVNLMISGNMDYEVIPLGEYPGMTNLFNELPVLPNVNGASLCVAFPEDLWMANVFFDQDVTSGITFKSIKPSIELFNTVTGQNAELDSVNINLENQVIDGSGVQQNYVYGSRGFLTIAAHDKNYANVFRVPTSDSPPLYKNNLQFGFRTRYEYWIKNSNIPVDLFDANEPQNGLNNYWHWLEQSDWVIQLAIYLTVDKAGTPGTYKNTFPMEMRDYFEVLDITPTCRHYDNSNGNSLYIGVDSDTGLDVNTILSSGITKIEQDYTLNTGVFPVSGIYAECNLEVWEGGGYKSMFTLSTEYHGETTNPLKPTGNNGNLLELVLVAPDQLRAICLLDPSYLTGAATKYKISGRIGCSTGNKLPTLPPTGQYDVQYDNKYS